MTTCGILAHKRAIRYFAPIFVLLALMVCGLASAAPGSSTFNHSTTGFQLAGAHNRVSCESCHTQGVFLGTPKDCSSCHIVGGRAPGKPTTHFPTTGQCDSCHRNTVTFAGAIFDHSSVNPPVAGRCSSCHGTKLGVKGKDATHIPTSAQCDVCHKSTTNFSPAGMNHAATKNPTVAGNCKTCHDGVLAQGKSSTHIITMAQCDVCHTSTTTFKGAVFDHATIAPPVAGRCSSCHGVTATGKSSTHIPTTAQCDVCHKSTTSFKGAVFDHASAAPPVAGRCDTCHGVTPGVKTKSSTHIPTTAQCDTCHKNTSNFVPAVMSHSGTKGPLAAGNCIACHSGSFTKINALAKPINHVSTTSQCDVCHFSTTTFKGAVFDHASASPPVAGRCDTCHGVTDGVKAKSSTHIPTTAQCDTCHKSTSNFVPAAMNHAGTKGPVAAGNCASCHGISLGVKAKSSKHIPTTAQCDTCHKSTSAFTPATMSHSGTTGPLAAGNCISCHSGSYVAINALAKPVNHVSTTAQCDVCHKSTTTFKGAVFDHASATPPVAGRCDSCHGVTAGVKAKSSTHIPTTAQCDTCHKSTSNFVPAVMSHSGTKGPLATGNCITCHSGKFTAINALAKPVNHVSTTAQCDVCHFSTTTFKGAVFDHASASPPVAGRCDTCHGVTAGVKAKPSTHIPTTAQCDTCHKSTSNFVPAAMNHAGTKGPVAAGNCASCHGVSLGVKAKSSNHIPTTAQCDVCHKSTTAFHPTKLNHTGTTGPLAPNNCSTCHNGAYVSSHALAKPANHVSTTSQCDVCHKSYTTFAGALFDHALISPPVAGRCSSCHGVTAKGKTSTHIPTTAQCDTCHKNTTSFAPAAMSHTGTTGPLAPNNCTTCHSGSYVAINAQAKPANHLSTTAQCDVCHKGYTTFAGALFDHALISPPVAGRCSSCHGVTAKGKTSTHIPTTAQCDTCHKNTTSFAPAKMSHTGTTGPLAAGNCSTCHSGSYVAVNALAKPANHLSTTSQCDVCHKSYTTFAGALFDHALISPPVAGRCSSCHGVTAKGKTSTHIPTTAQCDTCHKNTTSFAPAKMSHTGTTGPLAAGNCSTCHSGSYVAVNALAKPANHLSTTSQCDVCHKSYTTFAGALFDHALISPPVAGRCSSCHGVTAKGKTSTHIPTTAQCDTCHKNTTSFAPAKMSHTGTTGPLAAGNCSTCHSGSYVAVNALAKPANHLSTTSQCDVCHKSYTTFAGALFDHALISPPVAGRCSSCHGVTAKGKTSTHIPTTAQCDTCHKNTTSFAPAAMSHTGTTGPLAPNNCTTCHSGSYVAVNALAKPANHLSTTAQCDVCHKGYTTFAGAIFDHTLVTPPVAGRCSSCHGVTAKGKNSTHIPTTAQCDTCHKNTTSFAPAAMSHTGTTGPLAPNNCTTCHSGSYIAVNALAKPANHLSTTAQCDVCHKGYTTFAGAIFDHTLVTPPVAGRCSSCHGVTAKGKNSTHIPTTAQCDTCHKNTTSFAPAAMSHTGTTGPLAPNNCTTCHSGSYIAVNALAKPANHLSTTAQCDVCHKGYTTFAGAVFNHTLVTPPVAGRCSSCHGVTAKGKTATHIPTTAQCDTCHKNTNTFAPATMSHTGTTGPLATNNCSTCHSGAYLSSNALAKPSNHLSTTSQCDVCHKSYTTFAGAIFDHALISPPVAGRCSSCHGVTAKGKTATHIPTTAQCDVCHKNTIAFNPATMSHTGTTGPVATGNCATCHNGSYLAANALGKPANHIPTTFPTGIPGNECSLCHSSTTAFSTEKMNHGSMQTSCATCHDSTSPYLGSMDKINRSKHNNAGTKDCSSSGCHKPLGSRGSPYSKWD